MGRPGRYPTADLILIGQLMKPHGLRGEIRCLPITDYPERFESTESVHIYPNLQTAAREIGIVGVRWQSSKLLLQLDGIDTVEQAEKLRNVWVAVGEDEVYESDDGELYHYELEGLDVVDENGQPVGVLAEVLSTPAHQIYVIRSGSGELLVPAVPAYVLDIDLDARRVRIQVPREEE